MILNIIIFINFLNIKIMNECLVTKLKSSIQDESLPYLGGIVIEKWARENTVDNAYFSITMEKPGSISILNDSVFYIQNTTTPDTNNLKEKSLIAGQNSLYADPSNGVKLLIRNKYDIKSLIISSASLHLDDLKFSKNLISLHLSSFRGEGENIDSLKGLTNLRTIKISESNYTLEGDISSLSNIKSLTALNVTKSLIKGNIAVLGALTSLNELSIADTNISGSIESFVNAQIAAGRTSATVSFPYARVCKYITYMGSPLNGNSYLQPASDSNKLSWTSDGTITWS